MPRQNFISKDFFAEAHEHQVKSALLQIPSFVDAISFVRENSLVQSSRFSYKHPDGRSQYIDVSLMQLNDGHTHVTLHGSYENGHSFYKDPWLNSALETFESAAIAALQGSTQKFHVEKPKRSRVGQLLQYAVMIPSSIGILFMWRKIS